MVAGTLSEISSRGFSSVERLGNYMRIELFQRGLQAGSHCVFTLALLLSVSLFSCLACRKFANTGATDEAAGVGQQPNFEHYAWAVSANARGIFVELGIKSKLELARNDLFFQTYWDELRVSVCGFVARYGALLKGLYLYNVQLANRMTLG
jgi:hypothetical protein